MRFLFVFVILAFLAPAVHADGGKTGGGGGEPDANWANEAGAHQRSDDESAAARFLREVAPEQFGNSAKTKAGAANTQITGQSAH